MKINKWLLVLAAAGMFTAFTAGYSEAQTAETSVQKAAGEKTIVEKTGKKDFSELNGKTGTAFTARWSEENFKNLMNYYCNCKIEKFIYNESMTGCLSMLKSARADFMFTTDITANYIIQRNPEYKSLVCDGDMGVVMVLRNSDAKLKDLLNSSIAKIKESGKSDELYKKWITQLPVGQEPSMTKIEKTADTETVYVGVSGDVPPLDYIAGDGKPAGFSIALLAEISKIIGKNIEVVSLDSQARFTALESKKIDVFFWIMKPVDKAYQEKLSENAEEKAFIAKFSVTEPYCLLKLAFLLKK